jgi:hypothetical protein
MYWSPSEKGEVNNDFIVDNFHILLMYNYMKIKHTYINIQSLGVGNTP